MKVIGLRVQDDGGPVVDANLADVLAAKPGTAMVISDGVGNSMRVVLIEQPKLIVTWQ